MSSVPSVISVTCVIAGVLLTAAPSRNLRVLFIGNSLTSANDLPGLVTRLGEAGATPAIYMVWPARSRQRDFDRVSESHRPAAAKVNGVLLPAGDAWRAAWKKDPSAALYSSDNFHPSRDGSWLAALVIYCRLADRPPRALLKFPDHFPKHRELLVGAAEASLADR